MRILVISQYFWPENFKINDLVLGLKERGHEVSVLTGLPNYPSGNFFEGYDSNSSDEIWEGIKVYRSKLIPRGNGGIKLFINYISFVVYGWLKVNQIKGSFDKIFVYEPSPITVGIPAIHASKKFKAPYYFWVQDLWPESLTAAGGFKNPLILNFFDKITRLIYKKSEKVLVQSEGFKEYILKQDVPEEKLIFYPNSTEAFYKEKPASPDYQKLLPEGFNIIFAGNLGKSQSLDTLISAAQIVKQKGLPINWVFLGEGRYRETFEKIVEEKGVKENVFLLGSFPSTEMPNFFACADALIASLKNEKIFDLTIPAKIQSYMACGKPILVSMNGEGAKIVTKAKCGFSSSAENAEKLAENVEKLYHLSSEQRKEMGENGVRYFKDNFEREMLLDKLISILEGKK